jgi:hypothetical protein
LKWEKEPLEGGIKKRFYSEPSPGWTTGSTIKSLALKGGLAAFFVFAKMFNA